MKTNEFKSMIRELTSQELAAKSFSAYHFESQSRITPTRKPIGCTF